MKINKKAQTIVAVLFIMVGFGFSELGYAGTSCAVAISNSNAYLGTAGSYVTYSYGYMKSDGDSTGIAYMKGSYNDTKLAQTNFALHNGTKAHYLLAKTYNQIVLAAGYTTNTVTLAFMNAALSNLYSADQWVLKAIVACPAIY